MLVMSVDLLRWVKHHQKVLAVTGKILTCHPDKVGVVSIKLNGYGKYPTTIGSYPVLTLIVVLTFVIH